MPRSRGSKKKKSNKKVSNDIISSDESSDPNRNRHRSRSRSRRRSGDTPPTDLFISTSIENNTSIDESTNSITAMVEGVLGHVPLEPRQESPR